MPNTSRKTGLLFDKAFNKHVTGPGHPEAPVRLEAIEAKLKEEGLFEATTALAARPATDEEILRCHTAEYLKTATADIEGGARMLSTGDTSVCPESMDVARLSTGGVIGAAEAVLTGKVDNAFCAVRPPGHHATPDRGMGFCIFDNVALAARHAQTRRGIERILIADWDVHHGNGTQDIFYEDDTVFFMSTHQWPLYPGTGAKDEAGRGKGEGFTMNFPFPAGSGRDRILPAFEDHLATAMKHFKPQFVILSAGFDSRVNDPLGAFTLTDKDFADLTRVCLEIADKHADGKLLSVLEGGYNPAGLASAVVSHIEALME